MLEKHCGKSPSESTKKLIIESTNCHSFTLKLFAATLSLLNLVFVRGKFLNCFAVDFGHFAVLCLVLPQQLTRSSCDDLIVQSDVRFSANTKQNRVLLQHSGCFSRESPNLLFSATETDASVSISAI